MYTSEDVTIIVPHLGADENQERSLDICLRSLKESTDSEIIIARNGETSCQHDADVYIGRQGQNGAVNAAASLATTAWIFVTNDDMVYARGFMEKLLETARRYGLSFVCPNLVEPHPGAPPFLVQPFGGAGGDFQFEAWKLFAESHADSLIEQGFNLPFLITKELWDLVGGYDVSYDPWGSNGDSDLQAKILLSGAETLRERNVIVYHFSQTSGTFHPDNQGFWKKNWEYFKEKWGFYRQEKTENVWYSRRIIDERELIYKPIWRGMYRKPIDYTQSEKSFKSWN